MSESDYEIRCPSCSRAVGSREPRCTGCGTTLLAHEPEDAREPSLHLASSTLDSIERSLTSGAYDRARTDIRAAVISNLAVLQGEHRASADTHEVDYEVDNRSFTVKVDTGPTVLTEAWINMRIGRRDTPVVEELCCWLNRQLRMFAFAVDYEKRCVVNRSELDFFTAEDAISPELVANAINACIYGARAAAGAVAEVVAGRRTPEAALELAAGDPRSGLLTNVFEQEKLDYEAALTATVREVLELGEWHSMTGERWKWEERGANQFLLNADNPGGFGFVEFIDVEGASLTTTAYFTDSFERVPPERINATRELCSLLSATKTLPLCSVTPETGGVYTRLWTSFAGSTQSITRQMIDNCIRLPLGAAARFKAPVESVVLKGQKPKKALR